MSASPSPPRLAPVAAFVSLLVLALGATGLFSLHLTNLKSAAAAARLAGLDGRRVAAVEARAAFKTQVQEWKNILLRGRSPEDFTIYRERFEREEAAVRAELGRLEGLEPVVGEMGAGALLAEHARLGEAYRAALKDFAPDDPASAPRVDAAVRGIDRGLSDRLDEFARGIERLIAGETRAAADAAAARYEGLRRITWIVASLAMLASLWLVVLAARAGRA